MMSFNVFTLCVQFLVAPFQCTHLMKKAVDTEILEVI